MTLRVARIAYAVLIAILITVYYAVPGLRAHAVAAVGLVGLAAVVVGLVLLRPPRRGAWLLVGASVGLLAIGAAIYSLIAADARGPTIYLAAPGWFYLAGYSVLAAGVLWLGWPHLPSREWPVLLDTAQVTLAGSLILWITVARPAVTSMQLSGTATVAEAATWVVYVAVLAASARVLLIWRRNLSVSLVSATLIGFLILDFFYGAELLDSRWSVGTPIDAGFLALSALCGAAALTSSMAKPATARFARHRLGPARLLLLTVALLVAPTTLLVEATNGLLTTAFAIAIVSAAVGALLVIRFSLSAQAQRLRAEREKAVRIASQALVMATSEEEVVAGIGRALARMLPDGAPSEAWLETVAPPEVEQPTLAPVPPPAGAPSAGAPSAGAPSTSPASLGQLTVPVTGAPMVHSVLEAAATAPRAAGQPGRSALMLRAPMAELVEMAPVLIALADHAVSALKRIALVGALAAQEREQYFRTLVTTSTDVILISHEGVISYATPSAHDMFGRDVTGDHLEDLVDLDGPEAAPSESEGVEGRIRGGDGGTVLVRRRDLTGEPTVRGVVTTLRDVTAERDLQRDLAYRACHDSLTGLANAQMFNDELGAESHREPDRRAPPGGARAALFIDLDDFKTINDLYGHDIGDRLLVEVARRITSCLRSDDLAARIGGDEFAVLLRNVADVDSARGVAQRIADALGRPATIDGFTMDCQASIGLAYTDSWRHLRSLVQEADTALYTAKSQGKGQWRQFRADMPVPSRQYVDERRRLEQAIRSGGLTLHFQPIVEVASGTAVGFEALVRLAGSDPWLSPQQIITTAEETGLMVMLGEWVLGHALADAAALNPPGTRQPRYLSVNVSPRQLRQPDFVENVRAQLAAARVDPSLLVLEITEGLFMAADDRAWDFLAELRHDGVRVAIDDYGTGNSSLGYLRQTGVDIVKVDRSFLADIGSARDRVLLRALTNLCHELELDQVVEGVEQPAARDLLLELGCRCGQGFLYAPALPLEEAARWHSAAPTGPGSAGSLPPAGVPPSPPRSAPHSPPSSAPPSPPIMNHRGS